MNGDDDVKDDDDDDVIDVILRRIFIHGICSPLVGIGWKKEAEEAEEEEEEVTA